MAISTRVWTQTVVNGTIHVHFERRSAMREHADITPPPLWLYREKKWLIWCRTSPWACHSKTGLRLHTYMSQQAGGRILYNCYFLSHLLALCNHAVKAMASTWGRATPVWQARYEQEQQKQGLSPCITKYPPVVCRKCISPCCMLYTVSQNATLLYLVRLSVIAIQCT